MAHKFLLWDHDGVLVDTERWYFHATREVLTGIGVGLTQEQHLELMAEGRSSWELALAVGHSEREVRALREQRNELYQELLRTKNIEIDGVAEVLAQLHHQHRMAIVTTARRVDFNLIHEGRHLLPHFEFVLTVEDYPRAKPEPDPYLSALRRFGARPDEALVLEDSARGLRSAVAAGVSCIVIKNAFTASQDFGAALHVLDSVRQLPDLLPSLRDPIPMR